MTRGSAAEGGRRALGRPTAGLAALVLVLAGCDGVAAPGRALGSAVGPAVGPAALAGAPGGAGDTPLVSILGTGGNAPGLGEADRRQVRAAAARAYTAPDGRPVHWQNPRSGAFGEIVPLGEVRRQGARVCRDFRHVVMVAGRSFEGRGPACGRPPDDGGERQG